MTPKKTTSLLILVLAGLMLMVNGCSDNDVTAPTPGTIVIAEDPLDDVLKSTDGRTPADPRERCARLGEVLRLDEGQLSALTMAYTGYRDGMAGLRNQVMHGELTMDEARHMAGAMREAFEAEMQMILTAEQWDHLQDMRHEGRHGGGHHGGGHHHQGPTDLWGSMFEDLGLDADQIAAVLAALDVLREGMQDLRDQMHDGTMTYEEAHEAAEVLRDDFDTALQTILTEEQYLALLDLRPDCGGRQGR
jgi:hypothetical protein